jgi:electron transfer flavoprotein beta subunit
MAAELLGLPCVTAISSLEIANGKGTAKRELEGAQEIVEFPLPAVLTVDEGLNAARLPSLKGIMAAKKKEITTIERASLGVPDAPTQRVDGTGHLPPIGFACRWQSGVQVTVEWA